jgi:2-polyprenyl-3-methyl-5-hydroxy-6-metoxy-1,4-benzoquinol methylase
MPRDPSSWVQDQQQYYQALPHAHLQFDAESVYAQNIVAEVLKQAGLENHARILEVGCGSGRFTLHLARQGLSVTGLDLSPEQLQNLVAAAKSQGLDLAIKAGEISASGTLFRGKEFDGVAGFFILHHLEDVRDDLASLGCALKIGGRISFVEPNRWNPLFPLQITCCKDMTWKGEKGTFRYGPSGYRRCLEEAGYTDVEIKTFGFFPPQVLDNFPFALRIEKWIEKLPFVKFFLPFLLMTARKNGPPAG